MIRVSIEWSGRRGAYAAGPPVGAHSFTKNANLSEDGQAQFDQVLGPFAPIRTLDANVSFDVIDSRPEMNNAVVGKAKIGLRELQDQQKLQKLLSVQIVNNNDDDDGGTKLEY